MDIILIIALAVVIYFAWRWAKMKLKTYEANVKQDDYIWLFSKEYSDGKKYIVQNFNAIREFCDKYHKVRCYVICNKPPHLCFDGSLIEFFIDHIEAGNQAATFDVEAAKKLQASNRKFGF